jgi:hypothetical protein
MRKNTIRDFIKQAAVRTAAFLAYPRARVLGANDRVRVAMIGAGSRGQQLLQQTLKVPSLQVVAVPAGLSRFVRQRAVGLRHGLGRSETRPHTTPTREDRQQELRNK